MNWMAYVLRAYLQPAQTSNIYCAQRLTLSCLVYLISCSNTLLWASSQVCILEGIEWYHIASYMVDFEMATMECMQLSLHYRPGRCMRMASTYLTTWICTLGVWSNHACIIPCTNSLVHSMNPCYTHTHTYMTLLCVIPLLSLPCMPADWKEWWASTLTQPFHLYKQHDHSLPIHEWYRGVWLWTVYKACSDHYWGPGTRGLGMECSYKHLLWKTRATSQEYLRQTDESYLGSPGYKTHVYLLIYPINTNSINAYSNYMHHASH